MSLRKSLFYIDGYRHRHRYVCLLLSHVWFCDPMDCSPPGLSVSGILQARILEWVAIPFFRGSSWPRDWTWVSCIAGEFFTTWATRETNSYRYWYRWRYWIKQSQSPPQPLTLSQFKNTSISLEVTWTASCQVTIFIRDWLIHSIKTFFRTLLCILNLKTHAYLIFSSLEMYLYK